MRFLRVLVRDFRSYPEALLEPGPGLNLLVGPNAAGKTNLLEALAVLAAGRSPRIKGGELLVRRGAEVATLEARFLDAREAHRKVRVGLRRAGGRKLALDERPLRRLSDLHGQLALVQLFPEDLRLPVGSPSLRRAWLDLLATQLVPGYLAVRKAEERALKQRNAALRAGRPARELAALDGPFLDRAAEVLAARAKAVRALRETLHELPDAEPGERVGVEYWALARDPALLRQTLETRLRATAADERRLQATQVGPHRDEVRLMLGELPVSGNASRGQLRSLLLRLKLAEAEALGRVRGKPPVLLLDDALSDMDAARRKRTLAWLAGRGQVFLTVPEAPEAPLGTRIFEVRPGSLRAFPGEA